MAHHVNPLCTVILTMYLTIVRSSSKCDLSGIFVTSINRSVDSIRFDVHQSWIVESAPGMKQVHCRVFFNSCSNLSIGFANANESGCSNHSGPLYTITGIQNPKADVVFTHNGVYTICLFSNSTLIEGDLNPFARISVNFKPGHFVMPVWLTPILIIILQFFSGLCSALNIGLMALSLNDLKILTGAGIGKQQRNAKKVYKLRQHGNFLLVSILACNTAFNSVNTVLLESVLKGIGASIASTAMVTIFGEIIPQAIGSRFALTLGYYTAWFTALMMIITSPVSFPAGKLLDFALGKQPPAAYPRENVQIILREQVPGVKDYETAMIDGMLGLDAKSVKDHMNPLKDVFMVDYYTVYDENLHFQIHDCGYSRIPVYRDNRTNIVGVIHIKALLRLGAFGHRTIGNVCEGMNLPFTRCRGDTLMTKLLMTMREAKSHMVIVEDETKDEDVHEAIGVITIEDIIEELLKFEILDEFDKNDHEKSKRSTDRKPWKSAAEGPSRQVKSVSLRLLSTLEPFTKDLMTSTSLSALIEDSYRVTTRGYKTTFYKYKEPATFFMLIISGKAVLEMKNEGIQIEAGPFTHYGIHALIPPGGKKGKYLSIKDPPYIPDFTLFASEQIEYIAIDREQYRKACSEWCRSSSSSLTQSFKSQISLPDDDCTYPAVQKRTCSE